MSKGNFKKHIVTSILTVLCAGAMLAGCDDVVATPTSSFYDEQVLTGADKDITNNVMSNIYDAIVVEGDTNSAKVLNNILRLYSESIYGKFYGEGGLYEAVKGGTVQAFADKYEVYGKDTKKVMSFYYSVYDKVEESFLSYIKNSSYQERSIFHEKKFYDTQVKAFYKLGDVAEADFKVKQVTGDIRLSDHRTGSVDPIDGVYFNDIFNTYESYIDDQILPEIYRTELVAQYLYKENYLALGNSYARKVQYIKLTENTKHADAVSNLMTQYAKNVIAAGLDMKTYGFAFLGNLYKGTTSGFTTEQNAMATTIYGAAQWHSSTYTYNEGSTPLTRTVYDETTLGGYLADYQKLVSSTNRESEKEVESIRKDFTNSNAYPALTGLHIKEQALIAEDESTSNWYTSGSLDAIPSEYSKRLFKGSIASTGVDHGTWNATTNKYDDTDLTTISGTTYGAYVGGNYYLVSKNPQTGDAYPYIIKDGTSFYLVIVDEAVNSSKISTAEGAKNAYDQMASHASDELYSDVYGEMIARAVAYNMSTSETYKTSSNQHWVELMAMNYHDTTIYDYFKKTFPDLFD